jgi:DNA-directed RNA polymerase specialized sigma subunit
VNPDHLFLGTQVDNMHDASIKNRVQYGILHHNSKLSERDVLEIRKINNGLTQREIATIYSVSQDRISKIKRNVEWRRLK